MTDARSESRVVCFFLCDCSVVTVVLVVVRGATLNSSSVTKGDSMYICIRLKTVPGHKTPFWIQGNPANVT